MIVGGERKHQKDLNERHSGKLPLVNVSSPRR
jgi:hypothetical protein